MRRASHFPLRAATLVIACLLVHCTPERAPQPAPEPPEGPPGAIVGTPDPALLRLLIGARARMRTEPLPPQPATARR